MSSNSMIRALFWNGGLSHVLVVAGKNVKIYQCLDTFEWEDTHVDVWCDNIQDGQSLEFPEFLNQDMPSMELNDVERSDICEGSALFHRSNGTFILAEKVVREICLLEGDSIETFHSDMGNSGVPYSYIKGVYNTYILMYCPSEGSQDVYRAYPNEFFGGSQDVYEVFYEQEIEGQAYHSKVIIS